MTLVPRIWIIPTDFGDMPVTNTFVPKKHYDAYVSLSKRKCALDWAAGQDHMLPLEYDEAACEIERLSLESLDARR